MESRRAAGRLRAVFTCCLLSALFLCFLLGYISNKNSRPFRASVKWLTVTKATPKQLADRSDDRLESQVRHLPGRTCRPYSNYIFIKIPKTGSSSLSNVLFLYGMKHDLVAALAPGAHATIRIHKAEDPSLMVEVTRYNCSSFPGYNYMATHVTYNRIAMEALIPKPKYFTIIRNPYDHVRACFYGEGVFSEMAREHTFESFLHDYYLKNKADLDSGCPKTMTRLSQTKYLGLGLGQVNNCPKNTVLRRALERLESEIDLVMIHEYYDESMVLLRKLMCWDFIDVVYNWTKFHPYKRSQLDDTMKEVIRKTNVMDMELYDYFNRTFWRKIEDYDGDFAKDLETFRRVKNETHTKCMEEKSASTYCVRLTKMVAGDLRHEIYVDQMKWMC